MRRHFSFLILAASLGSCATSNFLNTKGARDVYADKIAKTDKTRAENFRNLGNIVLNNPTKIPNDYLENGATKANFSNANAYRFTLKPGQKATADIKSNAAIFMDLWQVQNDGKHQLIVSGDTLRKFLWVSSYAGGEFILRWQSKFSPTFNYELRLNTSPMLAWPIEATSKSNVGSLWGDARDGGARKHEGIDIMATKGTPIVAVADGTVTDVSENEIGGLVVSIRPKGESFTVYYAHLEKQLVEEGQTVVKGQTLGTVGNTGNAKNSVPHLHFGIYDKSGVAINPLYFVQDDISATKKSFATKK